MVKPIHQVKITLILVLSLLGIAFGFSSSACAAPAQSSQSSQQASPVLGLGQVASNMLEPVTIASSFLSGISIVIGMTCLFSAFLRYMQHRINPLAQPISTVFLLVVLGVILLALPLVYRLTESGIPFSLK